MRQLLIYVSMWLLCGSASAQGFNFCGVAKPDFVTQGLCADQRRDERYERDKRDREQQERSPQAASVVSPYPVTPSSVPATESDEQRQKRETAEKAERERAQQAVEAEGRRMLERTAAMESRLNQGTALYLELVNQARSLNAAGKFTDSLAVLERASNTAQLGDYFEAWRLMSEAQAALGDYPAAQHSVESLVGLLRFDGKVAEAEQLGLLVQKYQTLAFAEERRRTEGQSKSADPFELAQRQTLVAETRRTFGRAIEDREFVKLQQMNELTRQKTLLSAVATLKTAMPKTTAAKEKQIDLMRRDANRIVAQLGYDNLRNRIALQLPSCESGNVEDCAAIADYVGFGLVDPGSAAVDAVFTIHRVSCLNGVVDSCFELENMHEGRGRPFTRRQWNSTQQLETDFGYALLLCEMKAHDCFLPVFYLSGNDPLWKHPDVDRALLFADLTCRNERTLNELGGLGCHRSESIRDKQRETATPHYRPSPLRP